MRTRRIEAASSMPDKSHSATMFTVMEWLNYHHLLYFWMVARQGSIARACEELRLSQPTISGQLRQLENSLGEKLFTKSGRNLKMTEFGTVVYRYADEIFSIGRELMGTVRGRPSGSRPLTLLVGITDSLPKLIAYRLIEPALQMPEKIQVICREGKSDELMAQMAMNALDIVLSDSPFNPEIKVRAFNHLLGESTVTFFGPPELARRLRRKFPNSLDGAPTVLPTSNTALRRILDQWFEQQSIRPHIAGQFEDPALLKVFGQAGTGIFPAPSVIEKEILRQYKVQIIGRAEDIHEKYYAISVERRIKHPAVLAVSQAARKDFFH